MTTFSGGTIDGSILPSQTGHDLGAASTRWDAFLQDLDASGTLTFGSGAVATLGTLTLGKLNNIRCVDELNTKGWAGTDVGGWINSAYADLPSTGGTIMVAPKSGGTAYSYTTPILLNTNGKPVKVNGQGASATSLNYTPGTGVAFTIDTGTANLPASGISDLRITSAASGSTATGLAVGPTNGAQSSVYTNVAVDGFKINGTNGAVFPVFINCVFGTGSSAAGTIGFQHTTNGDDAKIIGGTIYGTNILVSVSAGAAGPLFLIGVNLVNAQGGAITWISLTTGAAVFCNECHFVNFNNAIFPIFWNQTAGQLHISQSVFEDDRVTGSGTAYGTSAGSGTILNLRDNVILSLGQTATQFAQFTTGALGHLSGNSLVSTTQIPLLWNTSYGTAAVIESGTVRTDITPVIDISSGHQIKSFALGFVGNFTNPSTSAATIYDQSGVGPTISGNIFHVRTGATPALGLSVDGTQNTDVKRLTAKLGTALVAGDFALHANWGSGAAVSAVTGTDQGWQITVTAAGTPGASPTITLTFKDGTWTNAPICITKQVGGTGVLTNAITEVPTATTNVITWNGTPVAGSTYIFSGIAMGR